MAPFRNDRLNHFQFVVPRRGVAPLQGNSYRRWDEATTGERDRSRPTRCLWMHRGNGQPCRSGVATNVEGRYLPFCHRHIGAYATTRRHMEGILNGVSKRAKHGAYSDIIRMQIEAAFERNGDPELRREILADMQVMAAANPDDAAQVIRGVLVKMLALQERLMRRFVAGEITVSDYTTGMLKFAEETRKLALAKHTISGTQQDEQEEAIDLALDELGLGEEAPLGDVEILDEDDETRLPVQIHDHFPQAQSHTQEED